MKAKRQKDKRKLSAKAIKLKAVRDKKLQAAKAEADIMGAIAGQLVQLDERVSRLELVGPVTKGEPGPAGPRGKNFWGK